MIIQNNNFKGKISGCWTKNWGAKLDLKKSLGALNISVYAKKWLTCRYVQCILFVRENG